jgi:hypothetical protein
MQIVKDKVTGLERLVPTPAKFEQSKRRFTAEQYAEMKTNMENTLKTQKELGLGDPTESGRVLSQALAGAMGAQEANALFERGYDYIQEPDEETFPVFDRTGTNGMMTARKNFTADPKFALAKLGQGISRIRCTVGSATKEAPIPVIPAIHQELAKKAKEVAPNIQFHIAYAPQWELAPNRDPALLGMIDDKANNVKHWFMIGPAWGGDKELIEEHLIKTEKKA